MQVTVITPIAPHHEQQFVRCADSVRKQTVACRHLHMVDKDKRGPGHIRNKLLEQVQTEFVVFLDADDYLEPNFVEECLKVSQGDKYVLTNWYEGGVEKEIPDGVFWDLASHLITVLLHTDMVRRVGGFDENLPVMEDTELFLKFDRYDYCGIKVKKPLVHYTGEGMRSKTGRANGAVEKVKAHLNRRYQVACCGSTVDNKPNRTPIGAKQNGDVLVLILWEGNRNITGHITRRRYGRGALPRRIWMDKRDAEIRPDLFRVLPDKPKVAPKKAVRRRIKRPRTFADMLHAAGMLDLPAGTDNVLPVAEGEIKPDFEKLNTIAQRIYHVESKPKRRSKGNSKAIIPTVKGTDTVRSGSALRSPETGRELVAIGNG